MLMAMTCHRFRFLLLALTLGLTSQSSAADPVRFDRDVRPILSDKCFHCHGPDENDRQADLRLDLEEAAKEYSIVAGNSAESELIRRIKSDDPDECMPPADSNKSLTAAEIAILEDWVQEGAEWTEHWAFLQLQAVTPPVVDETNLKSPVLRESWETNAIDAFVLRDLLIDGLQPSPEADRETLIRRATLDLTGLPPTLAEVDAFLADQSPDAYERVLDRLLDSKHFGERMAVMWLDAARYGDTSVYHADGPRDMWAWRDTVVKCYNDNMPFDQFSMAQLAGDLLPDASLDQRVLSGFNRNNGTTDEGGAIAEEYRVEYAVDRVKTTSTVWLGLSLECAQCHDHKYDPITQEEYYQFYAFFNVSADKGMQTRNGNAEPTLEIPDPAKQKKLPSAEAKLAAAKQELVEVKKRAQPIFDEWASRPVESESEDTKYPSGAILSTDFSAGKGKLVANIYGNNTGKIQGKSQWIDTPRGKGIRLDGKTSIDFGDFGNFERDQSFSYGGWVKPNSSGGALLARMDDPNKHRGYDLYVAGGSLSVHIIHEWPNNAIKVTTNKRMKLDEWHHVFATYDGSSKAKGIQIYVDGELWDWKIEQDGLSGTIQTDKSFLIGSRHPGSTLKAEVDLIEVFPRCLTEEEIKLLAESDGAYALLAIAADQRTPEQTSRLFTHYLQNHSQDFRDVQQRIETLTGEIAELKKPLTTVMVMGDLEKPRDTFVLNRGAYDSPSDRKVAPNTMAVLPPMAEGLPTNRLGLANWLFSGEHPLTARVAVNRYWQLLFGTGLVSTPADFGSQGDYPSHPELLDWLAIDFRDQGWNIKRTLKQMMMSATYRQSAKATQEAYRQDPHNRRLARGPRFRLQGEFIRDTALSLSGLLDATMGGPGVKPYQPAGLWVEVGLSGKPAFKQDHGEKLFRRSLYTYWKRSAPPPPMQIFDAPTREKCTLRRPRTNTPLQALVVLNDPQFVEASRHFAQRILGQADDTSRLVFAFRSATSRRPSQEELAALATVLQRAREYFQQNEESALQLVTVGESPRDESIEPTELAAWTIVANTILNLDETLTRP